MNPTTYILKYPTSLRNTSGEVIEVVTELELRRLTGRDLFDITEAATSKGKGQGLRMLISRSAGVPPNTVDQLDAEDVASLGGLASVFIGGALQTTEE